ncbi:Glycogen debranching enzyme [Novipirellula aureliae]|uniref:Glycogen debranching enzyme n=1 Tax=Novipirellula aureliae TaxID=2527966 RepID=A0A5C6E783_9BACT|nr:isoamylase [Novipirellula aureliae]TWU44415.1 Glycogen debranching enzyme [Novipirellula aureliae]
MNATRKRWEATEGSPFPLGATWVEEDRAFNFSIYSKHAEAVRLLIYSKKDVVVPLLEYSFNYLSNKSGPIWHCRIDAAEAKDAAYYAYRVDGPAPEPGFDWHNFDFEKILLDPCAQSVFFPDGFSREAACRAGSNAGQAPLGVLPNQLLLSDQTDPLPCPLRHDSDLVIYELHVRGFTQHPRSGIPESHRGTFLGVVDKIPHLVDLGITAVELMPIFQFDPDDGDYWGYMPLNFYSPHHGYATQPDECNQQHEFRRMVQALHAVGIEVILDVVYNHTCEGDHTGPTYSFKGIDNSSAYIMTGDPNVPFANYSGTGNTLHTANRAIRRHIVDSLRFWDQQMHIDGFRFDLASIFTRNSDGSINLDDPPIIAEIGTNADLTNNRLIAEPWDAGGEFQLGQKFPGQRWMQWNARYRETLQRFVRGDRGLVRDLMTRLYGSADLFPDDRMHALQPPLSVNYITSHDGSTLYDLVSYNEKNNWANGHNNTDGSKEYRWNCGWEGDEVSDVVDEVTSPDTQGIVTSSTTNASHDFAVVLALRKQQVKNFICLLMLSNGTPMFRMGDEFLQTQGGNNNPYNQDNETSWLDWGRLSKHDDIFRFVKQMIAFRKSHPSISRSRFWRDDIKWYGTGHLVDMSPTSQQLAFCLHGASQNDTDLYVMINAADATVEFGIHEGASGSWRRVVDTSLNSPHDFAEVPDKSVEKSCYSVNGRSVVLLVAAG